MGMRGPQAGTNGKAKGGGPRYAGRRIGALNRTPFAIKEEAISFFDRILPDETEAKFWRYFMTGYVVDQLPDGNMKVIPIPVDPVMWAAFRRAVEYKRGLPIQPIAAKITGGIGVSITTNVSLPKEEGPPGEARPPSHEEVAQAYAAARPGGRASGSKPKPATAKGKKSKAGEGVGGGDVMGPETGGGRSAPSTPTPTAETEPSAPKKPITLQSLDGLFWTKEQRSQVGKPKSLTKKLPAPKEGT